MVEDFSDQGGVAEIPIASMVIEPGKKTNTSGPALRRIVSLSVTNSVLGQAVQVGRLDLPAVATKIGIAHVIGHNKNHVRTISCMTKASKSRQKKKIGKKSHFTCLLFPVPLFRNFSASPLSVQKLLGVSVSSGSLA